MDAELLLFYENVHSAAASTQAVLLLISVNVHSICCTEESTAAPRVTEMSWGMRS